MSKQGEGDKRSVVTDALASLGSIINDQERRDAIHLAVEPVQATTNLGPGAHVNAKGEPKEPFIGIVDPFLREIVRPGDWFWLVVYPRQIHSLRHVWTHPDFPSEEGRDLEAWVNRAAKDQKEESEKWLREFCTRGDGPGNYHTLLAGIEDHLTNVWGDRDYVHFDGTDAHGEIPPELWIHASNVLGIPIPEDKRATGFSCSC